MIAAIIAAGAVLAASGSEGRDVSSGTPRVFAPGEISGPLNVDAATFTPDGNTVFFDQSVGGASTIMVSRRRRGAWSTPQIAAFSGAWSDKDPSMAPDGSFIVFDSNRPQVTGGKPLDAVRADGSVRIGQGDQLWRVDRKGAGWSKPVRLPDTVNDGTRIYSPSVVRGGSVYFQRPDPVSRTFRIFRTEYREGTYQAPTPAPIGPAGADERDPAVAPDESFMVFSANYGAKGVANRLYISFREGESWGRPIDLGDEVNHDGAEGPHLGPGARTVYFDSNATTPITFPRTRDQAQRDVARATLWDNGASHLWVLDLAPWLDGHRARTP